MGSHQRLGRLEKSDQIIGSDLKNKQNQSLGKIDDLVVDLESGHILFAIVSVDGNNVALAPEILSPGAGAKALTIDAEKQKLAAAPRVNKDQVEQSANANFLKDVYQYWGQTPWWEGAAQPTGQASFGNVHKLSELKGLQVKNVANQDLGTVDDVALDLAMGRISFVILQPGGVLQRQGDFVYALPPNAFTLGADKKTLVTDIADNSKVASAPRVHQNNWHELSNPAFASQVYQFYGKQPYFTADTSFSGAQRTNDWRHHDSRHGATSANQGGTSGTLGQVEPARSLIGREIHGSQNDKLGKLDDLVVDLESGHVLYAVATVDGKHIALPPEIFSQSGENKPLIVQVDKQKLAGAPQITPDIQNNPASLEFANQVYQYFSQTPWWGGAGQPTGQTFGNVHRATELTGMMVKTSANENLGKLDNVIIDLAGGRIPFVILSTGGSFGANQFLYPVPPNAFTAGTDQKTLTTGLDREKLQGAPRIQNNNLRQLSDPAFAASVYQYYGKQPYWNTVAPTGR